jgi:ech hydrogenase subunit A
MNQVGGVAILFSMIFALIFYESYYFDILLLSGAAVYLLPMSFLVIAAMVKGASLPFEKWLLGAMVAPTPVSAILHSATMVKIAPFLVLKIAGGFTPTLSMIIVLFGSFIFMVASIMALSPDFFKEVLGLSTIALLSLMVAIAAIGTVQTQNIVLILIVFHALSKALLFVQAGILEKEFHFKYLSDINTLVSKSKLVVFFIIIGFASLTLPPFGAFMGKFLTIELLAGLIETNPLYLVALVFVLIGSVVLTLLYFKVLTKLLPKDTIQSSDSSIIPTTYILTSLSLVFLLLYGVFKIYTLEYIGFYELLIPTVILVLSCVLLFFSSFKSAHRVNEYNCGEKDPVLIQSFYFHLNSRYIDYAKYISIGFFLLILVVGAL